ncbi:hypothetical protein IC235_15280 [Hymenobacter sp. BT664]|uniref:Uncharacterized protein n=1 Tax=Hymenobacter montanus TaxID=2771359 RepID=A0A927GK71_9BACT|nr:hypothetical protein [Hymenobacter montanus]MBD2769253.1 hypothetical protein [Hymenobacter montanus]
MQVEKGVIFSPSICPDEKESNQRSPVDCHLQQQPSAQTVAQMVREHGIGEATSYVWMTEYDDRMELQVSESMCLKQL